VGKAQTRSGAARTARREAARAPEPGFQWGLADGLGLTLLLALIVSSPFRGDSTAVTAMMITVGALACLPFGIARWRGTPTPGAFALVPVGAAIVLLVWGVISAVGSGAPWQASFYGWFGRSDGLLTLLAVVALLASASTLRRDEIDRVITWLLAAGAITVLEGMAQLLGSPYPPRPQYEGLAGALGNPNFFAAATSVLALLALGRALASQRPPWQRWAALALLLGLLSSTVLSNSEQGPVSFVLGLIAGGIAWSLQHRGRGRGVALGLSAMAIIGGVIGLVLIVMQVGPFAAVRQAQTIGYREAYWEAAWRMMSGLPVFGSGPDNFARYVAAFRTEEYLEAPGSLIRVSAAHAIPLQYGATFGLIGLVAWLVLMIGTGVLLLRALLRGVDHVWVAVSLTGAWVAYLAQAMISIDAPGLKALGWLVTGLVIAFAINRGRATSTAAVWRPWLAGGFGLLAVLLWWPSLATTNMATSLTTVDEAKSAVLNPAVPCPLRQQTLSQLAQSVPWEELVESAQQALDLDPRCAAMAPLVSEIALNAGDLDTARRAADIAVETDPLAPASWFLLSLTLRDSGDQAGADKALDEARRLATIDPSDNLEEALSRPAPTPTPNP